MVDLITATQCLAKLEAIGIKYSKGYFSQMTSEGKIPHHSKQGSPKKFYRFEEVHEAILSTQDPTRDAQREANAAKRKPEPIKVDQTPQQITAILTRIKEFEELKIEMFDRSQLDTMYADQFECDIEAINEANGTVRDLTFELLKFLDDLTEGNFRNSKAELRVSEFLERWIVKPETVRELYAID